MADHDNERTQREALTRAGGASSADRAHLWAGLNRYLAAEAAHQQKVAEDEQAEASADDERDRAATGER